MSAARFRSALVAGATAVVIGAGFTVAGLDRRSSGDEPSSRSAAAPLTAAVPPRPARPDGDPGLLPPEDAAATGPSASPTASRRAPATSASPAPRPTTTTPKPRAARTTEAPARERKPKAPAPRTGGSVVDRVLSHINAARAGEGLPALRLDGDLSKAAARHNQAMIGGCGLNHQCPGERGLGERFSAQGVRWSSAGENIGFGSAGSGDAAIAGAANGLTDSMLAETPPNDGHRRNLLSRGFDRVGLSVVRDGGGRVWMTQDFVG